MAPWGRFVLEKLIVAHLVTILSLYGTQMVITVFRRAVTGSYPKAMNASGANLTLSFYDPL